MNKYKLSYYNIYSNTNNQNIIFNTFTKGRVLFDDILYNQIKNNDFQKISDEDIQQLLNLGIIVPNEINEYEIIKEYFFQYRKEKKTLFVTLVPTFMCNFRCNYCFEGSLAKENKQIIDFSILKKFAEKNFKNYYHIHVTLFGGEPLLVVNKCIDFFEYFSKVLNEKQTFSSSIATNAYLMNEKVMDNLIKKCHCQNFQITIDGYKRTHNKFRKLVNGNETYDVVLKNFKKLLSFKNNYPSLNIVLRVNLFNNTIEEVTKLLEEFKDDEKEKFSIYFRGIYATKEFQKNNTNEKNLINFYKLAIQRGFKINENKNFSVYHCEGDGGTEQIHILPDGNIYKCINDMSFEKSHIGFINENGDAVYNKNIDYWEDYSFFDDKECNKCKYLPMCWGGCPLIYKKRKERICIHEKIMDSQYNRKDGNKNA